MKLKEVMSRERIVDGFKSMGKLRIRASHSTILTFSALLLILFVAFTIRVLPLRWETGSNALHLSEFDPYYQYSLTNYMVKNGLLSPYWPNQWVDTQRWYPDGINMGQSLSSLPMTAAIVYGIITALGVNIDLMSFCALVPVVMGTLAVLVLYFLGKDMGGKAVGMLAALFMALSPSVIQRTSLGFFDTEVVGLFSLLLCSLLFLRAIEENRPINSTVKYSIGSAAALAYFIMGWGAAYYLIGLITLFVFVLILLKRYTRRLFLAYSVTFGLGLLIAMNNPDISIHYLTEFVVLPVAGVFVLLCLNEVTRNLASAKGKITFIGLFLAGLVGGFAALWTLGYGSSVAGKFLTVLDPLLRESSPLVESVAEHKISTWSSIYYELGIGILFFTVGLFFVARNPNNKNLFLLLFGLTGVYFASSMVRLLVILAPAFGILAAIGIIGILKPFITLLKEPPKLTTKRKFGLERVGREFSGTAVFLIFIVLMTNIAFSPQIGGLPKVFMQAYQPVTITAGSLPIVPDKPVDEWFYMLQHLSDLQYSSGNSRIIVCSWWDYGYWLTMLGNVTSLADNATINSTQIENIGFLFMSNETQAVKMLKQYNATYILVFVTMGLQSSNGQAYVSWANFGDEGKWYWMARISGKTETQQRLIDQGYQDAQASWTDEKKFGAYDNSSNWVWNDIGMNTTIYKLMYYGKNFWCNYHKNAASDAVNDPDADNVTKPQYFSLEYLAGSALDASDASSQYGGLIPLVCLYKINYPDR